MNVTSPANNSTWAFGHSITLRASTTCPSGETGEVQFWVRLKGVQTWTKLPGYTTTSSTWTPPDDGIWKVTAVVRAVGETVEYDVKDGSPVTTTVSPPGVPVAVNDTLTTNMSTAGSVNVLANDFDPNGDPLTVTGFTQAAHGSVAFTGGAATYTPVPGYVGADSFTYTISDGFGSSATASVAVTVNAVTPVCTIAISGPSVGVIGSPVQLSATASCNVGTPEIEWYHAVSGGTFSVFQPFGTATAASFDTSNTVAGTHAFYAVARSLGTAPTFNSNTLSVSLADNVGTCTAVVVDAPVAGRYLAPSMPATLHATVTCPQGLTGESQFWVQGPGDSGWTVLPGYVTGDASWSPPRTGAWSIMAVARAIGAHVDFQVQSPPIAVTITNAPKTVDDALVVDEDTSGAIDVLANDYDPNGDALTASIVSGPASGTASITGGILAYTPAPDYNGGDTVTYQVDDGTGNTATATVRITVNPVNDAPVPGDDVIEIAEDSTGAIDVLANDHDVDGDALAVTGVGAAAHGSVVRSGSVVTYVPDANFNGDDSFSYTLSDGRGGTATGTVFVTVSQVNDAPTAVDDELDVAEDTDGGVYVLGNDTDPDNDLLSVVSYTQPAHGSVTISAGFASYHPARDYNGDDSFTYTLVDSGGVESTATVHISIAPVNDAPVAANDAASLDEDASATLDVVANDTDVDGDALAVTSITQPAHGTATIVAGHVVGYAPAANYTGSDSFSYTISDAAGATATATVAITVNNVNDAPVAVADSAAADEDTAVSVDVVANDTDIDGDALTIVDVTQPAHGAVAIASAHAVTYTPAANYHGADSFTYTIDDGHGGQASAAVAVDVTSVDDPPVAAADSATTLEDTAVTVDVVANDTDVDGDTLVIASVEAPAHGTAVVEDDHHITYTPARDYNGADAFIYTISDGNGGTASVAVDVAITPVNDAPVALADLSSVVEDGSIVIDVAANDGDVDGDPLTISGVTAPAAGTVAVVDAHHVSYTPAPNYNGADGFTYTIVDPSGAAATGAVAIDVIPVNDPPVANNDGAALDEDTSATVDVVANDADVDGDALAITGITQPAHGTAVIADAHRITYTPAANYHGVDGLSYTITDGNGGSATAELALVINNVNDAPVAAADSATTSEDTAVTIDVVANDADIDGDALTVSAVTQPAHGTAAVADEQHVVYTPAPNYHGADAFTYTIVDPSGAAATAAVAIDVVGVNDPPVAANDTVTLDEDTTAAVDVVANDVDVDGDALAITAITQPAHGTATVVDTHHISYTPAANYHGTDSLIYTIGDGSGAVATASLDFVIASVNDAPVAVDDSAALDEDTAATVDVVANDSDVDGDALAVAAITQPAHGAATIVDAHHVRYTPAANYNGADALTYTVSDGNGAQATATLQLAIANVNDPPVAVGDGATLDEDTTATVDVAANDSDLDGDALTVASITQPAHGTATIVDTHHVGYTPAANYHGADSLTYTVADGNGGTATASIDLVITAVNDAPVAVADSAATDEDTSVTIDVVANDSDVDGDTLAITAVTDPAHGSATVVDATHVAYMPAPNYHGADTFTYTIADPSGATATATVTIDVISVDDPPVAAVDTATLDEDTSVTVDVVANDSDIDGDALAVIAVTEPAHGTATVADAHHITYTPAANYHGSDSLLYTISDGAGGTATGRLDLVITSVNDPPVAVADSATLDEDTAATVDVTANDTDVDGDTLTVTAITQPAHGAATIVDAQHVRYVPAADYHGADALTYTVSDGNGGTASASLALVVNGVNDPPVAVDDSATTDEDSAATIDVVANDSDVDGDTLSVSVVTAPAHGAVTIADAQHVTYTPAPDYNGADAFTYTVTDPSGATATATVTVAVTPVNDPPIANADAATLDEDTSVTVDVVANDFDIDGDTLAVTAITQPAHGLALIVDGQHISYTPAPNYFGVDSLSYTVSDGNGGTATAELDFVVNSVNDAPVAIDDTGATDEDSAVTVDVVANDSDLDGDALAIAAITQPAHGTATISDEHHVRYAPAPNYNGADSLTYTIDDGRGGQATGTLALGIASVNDPPVAVGDTATLDEDATATLDLVANDSDVDGDTLTILAVTQPAHGTATIADAAHVSYRPAADWNGADAFTYTIGDGNGATATATVMLTVNAVNDAPAALPVAARTFDGTAVSVALLANDVDGDPLTFAVTSAPAHGALSALAGNTVTYTPVVGFTGTDSFTFTASDGQALSNTGTVTVTVVEPVCGNGAREGLEECDDGNLTGGDGCEATCKLTCGSGTGALRATVDAASGHCFAAYDGVRDSYQKAAGLCSALGAHLPTLTSASEDAAAFAAVKAGDTPWLGADDIAAEGTFTWTSGEAFGYTSFAAGQPDNAGNQDCLRYTSAGTWDDTECAGTSALGVVCEFDLVATTAGLPAGGTGAKAIASADFNGDGFADVAAANNGSSTVSVLFGNGAGGFAPAGTYATDAGPISIATADFNGDGHPDLAVANASASTINVLLGSASGTFTSGGSTAIGITAPVAIVAGDFNNDGNADVAVGASLTVRVYLGNGQGGFATPLLATLTTAPQTLVAGDFDRDGKLDLAIGLAGAVVTLKGLGDGTLGLPVTVGVTSNSKALSTADLDGDGILDLAAINGTAAVTVWFGTTTGGFAGATTLSTTSAPQVVTAGDFDGDGAVDVAVGTSASAVRLFHNTGNRTFTQATLTSSGGTNPVAAVAAAVDGDGTKDLVVVNTTTSNLGVLLGGPTGFAGARVVVAGASPSVAVAADFNEDGRADLALASTSANTVVLVQTASGALTQSATIAMPGNSLARHAAAADFNGDGHADLAITNPNANTVGIALGRGDGTFGALTTTGLPGVPKRLAVADFNNDGKPDLAVATASGNDVAILLNSGTGTFTQADIAFGFAPNMPVVGDFNGDGNQDIAVAMSSESNVRVLLGRGDGTFASSVAVAVASAPSAVAAADLDGDGKLDLVSANPSTSNVTILRGSGTGTFTSGGNIAVGVSPQAVTIGDLDGDDRPDIVTANSTGNSVTILHGSGPNGFTATAANVGTQANWATIVDLDNDGHLDLAVTSTNAFLTLLVSPR